MPPNDKSRNVAVFITVLAENFMHWKVGRVEEWLGEKVRLRENYICWSPPPKVKQIKHNIIYPKLT